MIINFIKMLYQYNWKTCLTGNRMGGEKNGVSISSVIVVFILVTPRSFKSIFDYSRYITQFYFFAFTNNDRS